MTAKRHYRLLCPIARALDVVGDRWALLIVRDLHAGPARFQDLETGLGIATNLLSTRLAELADSGLIEKSVDGRRRAYQLTDLGRRTDRLLWELTQFGSQLAIDDIPREPGNLRSIVLPLRMLLSAVSDRPTLIARLLIDSDSFTIVSTSDGIEVEYGENDRETDVVVRSGYQQFLNAGQGPAAFEDFAAQHLEIIRGAQHAETFVALMRAAMARGE